MKEDLDHLRYSDVNAVTQEMQEKCPELRKILLSIMLPTAKKLQVPRPPLPTLSYTNKVGR